MQLHRVAAMLAGIALAGGMAAATLAAAESKPSKEGIWQDEPRQPRSWWNRGLSDEMIERAMKGLRQRDPATAKRLAELRRKDSE